MRVNGSKNSIERLFRIQQHLTLILFVNKYFQSPQFLECFSSFSSLKTIYLFGQFKVRNSDLFI